MSDEPFHPSRDLLPAVTATALLVLAWLAFDSIAARNSEVRDAILADLHAEFEAQVANWEREVETDLDEILTDALRREDALSKTVRQFRRTHPWFDSVYVWRPVPDGSGRTELLFPASAEPLAPLSVDPCVARARRAAAGQADPLALPTTLQAECGAAPPAVRVYAFTEAAAALRAAGQPEPALHLLTLDAALDRSPTLPRQRGEAIELPVQVRLQRWMLLAAVHRDLGRAESATQWLEHTIVEVTELPGPQLELCLRSAQLAVEEIEASGRQVPALRGRLDDAMTRLAAYRTLQALRDDRDPNRQATAGARYLYDPDAEHPHVLYVLQPGADTPGVALHLRPNELLHDFVTHQLSRFANDVVIKTRSGGVLIGAQTDRVAPSTEVPFTTALQGVRVGMSERSVAARVGPLLERTFAWRNLVLIVSIVLGFGALWAFTRADREHRALLRRQREFTARVTHELKTPLAGIRVMAEMLSIGAFKTDRQRTEMADSIVKETDRLTSRVDEILQVGRKRAAPTPVSFDIEEPVMECIEAWGPRYEQAGVTLLAELDPIDTLRGHPDAIRDAVSCLLDNALKYRREGIESKVWLSVRAEGAWAEIEVLDNGIGVPIAKRAAIFERFVRVEGDNRGRAGGHGLGLAQVAEIVEMHHGKVSCAEGIDGGARFVILLPIP
jgi:signal transduction histidine kinase